MTTVDRLPDHLERIGCQLTAAAQDLYGSSSPSERQASDRQALRRQLVGELRPRPRRRPRMRIFAGVSAVSAAAAIALVALVGSTGSGGPAAAVAAIIHHALRAVTPPAGEILHTKVLGTQNGTTFANEVWRQTAPPYASRAIKDQMEFSDNGTTSFYYDPATNTIYERPDSSPRPAPNDPVAQVRQELASGQAQVTGTVVIDGTSLYKIDLPRGFVCYFDTSNYAPRYVDAPQRAGHRGTRGTVVRFRVEVYEYLPMTPANRDLLSVTAQHPGARIDTNPSDAPAF
ncbi:MAG: hypothetical protein JOY89_01870 [Solirubrobacterales bacterium]|nr:hypothetical protein [Solirubrobacterales bacterium]